MKIYMLTEAIYVINRGDLCHFKKWNQNIKKDVFFLLQI